MQTFTRRRFLAVTGLVGVGLYLRPPKRIRAFAGVAQAVGVAYSLMVPGAGLYFDTYSDIY